MSKYKLFLREDCSGRLGWGSYCYEDGLLELDCYGERSWHYVQPGSAVLVTLDEDRRDVHRLMPPRCRADQVMWLCGVPRSARCRTLKEYDSAVAEYNGGSVQHVGDTGWQVARSLGPGGRDYIVAAWVDMRIGRRCVNKMIEQIGCIAPDWYADELLRRRW